jgi:NADH-quinone oxidoreductase subunit G
VAVVASARATNEELFLIKRLAGVLQAVVHDVVPRVGEADGILVAADRNPNTTGAQLLGVTGTVPGEKLGALVDGVRSGTIKAILSHGEDLLSTGLTEDDLAKLEAIVVIGTMADRTTSQATVVLPAYAWPEKRGTMINLKGRIQRLNAAIAGPENARDDWEILQGLITAVGGGNGVHSIEDVFKAMAAEVTALAGLTLSRVGDLGTQLELDALQASATTH